MILLEPRLPVPGAGPKGTPFSKTPPPPSRKCLGLPGINEQEQTSLGLCQHPEQVERWPPILPIVSTP